MNSASISYINFVHLYISSYFKKGCQKNCMQQLSQKVLWVVLSALFVKEIWKNDTGGQPLEIAVDSLLFLHGL